MVTFQKGNHILIEIIGVVSLIIRGHLILYKRGYTHAIKVQSLRSLHTNETKTVGFTTIKVPVGIYNSKNPFVFFMALFFLEYTKT